MNIDDKYILEIGTLILRCEDVVEEDWDFLTFVFDVGEGVISNSGFIYSGSEIIPASAEIESEPLLLDNKIEGLRSKIYDQCNKEFKQILIQMESNTNRIKIDFEFDDESRWSITPANLRQIREELKPNFDN